MKKMLRIAKKQLFDCLIFECVARSNRKKENDRQQNNCPGERKMVKILIGRCRIGENIERKGVDGFIERDVEIEIAECSEEKWSGLTGDAGEREQYSGDNTAACGWQNHAPGRAPAGRTKCERSVPKRDRD
jgi:hypothetical protein